MKVLLKRAADILTDILTTSAVVCQLNVASQAGTE